MPAPLQVDALTHPDASRLNNPSAEHIPLVDDETKSPVRVSIERRNEDLDPQLVWRGKSTGPLEVDAPPIYVQERIHPKHLIEDLERETARRQAATEDEDDDEQLDLFADFNGVPDGEAKTEFYQHEAHWTNRMILGDALEVMTSLAERENLRGKVQCIYIDPPYGIKFNSNFQWSTTSRLVTDGKTEHITREPEQVKAFRDTWRNGIHSYMSYLYDRLLAARDLLTIDGSCFVQIGDENVHRARTLMDEVFGEDQFAAQITFRKKMMPLGSDVAEGVSDYILWYCKDRKRIKSRPLFERKSPEGDTAWSSIIYPDATRRQLSSQERDNHDSIDHLEGLYQPISLLPAQYRPNQDFEFDFEGRSWSPPKGSWKTDRKGMQRALLSNRIHPSGSNLRYIYKFEDYPVSRITNLWPNSSGATGQKYIVQTNEDIIKRCVLMSTDPGDIVLDPTCGSGTTAYVSEQWGRRWITIDTSRVALAIARTRLMSAIYPSYLLADTLDGQVLEANLPSEHKPSTPPQGRVRLGFVYERVPHITLGKIADTDRVPVIWQNFQPRLEALRQKINHARNRRYADESLGYNRDNPQMPPPPANAANPPFE